MNIKAIQGLQGGNQEHATKGNDNDRYESHSMKKGMTGGHLTQGGDWGFKGKLKEKDRDKKMGRPKVLFRGSSCMKKASGHLFHYLSGVSLKKKERDTDQEESQWGISGS